MYDDKEIKYVIDSNPAITTRTQAEAFITYINALCVELDADRQRYPFANHDGQFGDS